jgi:hypothetical protein
MESSKSIPGW